MADVELNMVQPVPGGQRRTLQVLAVALTAASVVLLFDFWPWFLLSMWTASLCAPLAGVLQRRTGGRGRAAALIVIGILLALLIPIGAGVGVVIPDAIELVHRAKSADTSQNSLIELVSKGGAKDGDEQAAEPEAEKPAGEKPESEAADAEAAEPEADTPKKPTDLLNTKPEKLVEMAKQHGQQAMTVGGLVASTLGSFALGMLMYFVGTYAALVHGDAAYLWLRARMPLSEAATDRLRDTYTETGRGLLYSVGLTALLQGGLATVAYVSLGVPRAYTLGIATIITSLIPAIGPFLVWGPVATGLYLAGHPIKAGILVAVGLLVVAPSDNILRPVLAKRGKLKLHEFVVFFSMVGAIAVIGGWGLVVGPLVFRMAREVLDMVHEQRAQTAARLVTP